MRVLGMSPKPTEDIKQTLDQYSTAVNLYNFRKMSRQSDASKTFAPVLNLLRPGFPGGCLAGLPTLHLEHTLLWLPDAAITRQTNQTGAEFFPS